MNLSKLFIRILFVIVLLLVVLFFIRFLSPIHLDDVSPAIQCDDDLLRKSDIFYVIPKFESVNISQDIEWCNKILSYNKTLALHGVYHTYKEFNFDRNETYLISGEDDFEKCFGFYPEIFKAPQISLSKNNKRLLVQREYKVDSFFGDIFHKVYHCEDQGYFRN